MPSLSTQARIASLTAFAEARAGDCGRDSGRFAKGNNCQSSAASPPRPKTLEQERIDAARDEGEEPEQATKADVTEDVKTYIRLSGYGWAEFVRKSQSHSPDTIRNARHAKNKAVQIYREEGAAGFGRYLEEIGLRSLSPTEARRIRPIRQRPSLPGQMRLPLSGDNCERNPGGTFAVGNNCQGGGDGSTEGSGSELSREEQDNSQRLSERLSTSSESVLVWRGDGEVSRIPGFEKSAEVKISAPQDVASAMTKLGMNTKQVAAVGVSGQPKSRVNMYSGGSGDLGVQSLIPLPFSPPAEFVGFEGETGAKISVSMSVDSRGNKDVEYGNFSVSSDIQRGIAMHAKVRASPNGPPDEDRRWTESEVAFADFGKKANDFFGAKIMELMANSLIEAESAGISVAETYAAGAGAGQGRGAGEADSFHYKGYSLWPRFGFDGPLPSITRDKIQPILSEIFAEGPDSPRRGVLTEDGWENWQNYSLSIQDLVETKQGERLWRDFGRSANMKIDFSDKTSKGYKKFQEAKRRAGRLRSRGEESRYYQWLWDTDFRFDPEIFFVERRMARFLESRNCGTGAGGFQKGNTCGGAAADVAAAAAEGAVTGAAVAAGKTAFFPPTVATGAAVGAAYGVIGGLYDAAMSPTRAGKAIAAVGSTDEKVATLVKGLGGSPKSVAKSKDGKRLTLDIKSSKGESKFRVEIEKDSITITPSKEKLSDDEVETIKQVAADHSGREVRVIVDKVPVSTMSKLAKAGFRIGVTVTGAMAAGLLVPMIPAVAGTAIEKVGGLDIEKSGVLKPIDKVFGL